MFVTVRALPLTILLCLTAGTVAVPRTAASAAPARSSVGSCAGCGGTCTCLPVASAGQNCGCTPTLRVRPGPTHTSGRIKQAGFCRLAGLTADVWAFRGYAYVGSMGGGQDSRTLGPPNGVRIVSLANPAKPKVVGSIAAIPQTSQEKVVVKHVETPSFSGDLLVVGIQSLNASFDAPRGIELWDVTNPLQPVHLAFWASGAFGPPNWKGVHELYLFQQGSRAFIGAACPYSEPRTGVGDFRLVEVTDPRNPVQVCDWGIHKDGGLYEVDDQDFFVHSVWANDAGTRVILSGWDAGAITLDISDPAHPVMIGRAAALTHSVRLLQSESVLLTTSEILHPLTGGAWGPLRLWDYRDPAAPALLSTFNTADSATVNPKMRGIFTVHNAILRGNTAYVSWYSDGVRILDLSTPSAPKEIAAFVPPSALIWGVSEDNGIVVASDINRGLYMLRAR